MHIPAYAHATIRAALPTVPTSRQVGALDCCLCGEPFGADRGAVPLGPTPTSGLFGCPACLTRLVRQARRARDARLIQDAERARTEAAVWEARREQYLAGISSVREAAEAVTRLADEGTVEPLRIAWLLVSLESAYAWAPENVPEPPESVGSEDTTLRDEAFRLDLGMISARAAVANRLSYHLINQATPEEPELCAELECPDDCSGRHETESIDCGPDAIFEDLSAHGVEIERGQDTGAHVTVTTSQEPERALRSEDLIAVLSQCGIDADDTECLVSAAAVGLVAVAWRDGPLEEIREADGGPSDGEVLAQGVDLYRRARAALLAARDDGPEALLAFQAVASDLDLPWAGGSSFTLRNSGGPLKEFVENLDNRVWYTSKVMREQGWRVGVLHRAASAALIDPAHFGMPGWPDVVASAVARLAELDRSDAPPALADLQAVESALLKAPDRLGVAALDWLVGHALLDR
ncbi:hypothetical protein QR97_02955 [Streptomyces sp. PBH53]|uniref:hypothetical protein n=1 Tax=Streptomyces sp. PBH53 TaxID=1577075 RepID=UPI000655BFB6|nr:hypothetical protein [Streptomyces sp. PBH53]AKN68908.1 hypothetical protein QR97_02955 [Streptomyces sp. PBH53]